MAHLVKVDLLQAREQVLQAPHHEQLPVPHVGLPVVRPHAQLAHHCVQAPLPSFAYLPPCVGTKLVLRHDKSLSCVLLVHNQIVAVEILGAM